MLSDDMKKMLSLYNEGLALYKNRQFKEAVTKFLAALEAKPDDGPSKLYVERCEALIENPPDDDWDGIFTMTTK